MKYQTFILFILCLFGLAACTTAEKTEAKKLAVEFLQTAGKAAAVEVADASLQVFDTKIVELETQLAAYRASLPQPISWSDAAKVAGYKTAITAAKDARRQAAEKLNKLRTLPSPAGTTLPTVVIEPAK